MNKYRIVCGYDKENNAQFAEEYEALLGPDDFFCLLTEPEDRCWNRDLWRVIERLEEQEQKIEQLQKDKERLDWLSCQKESEWTFPVWDPKLETWCIFHQDSANDVCKFELRDLIDSIRK